jgi:hypothetical protein
MQEIEGSPLPSNHQVDVVEGIKPVEGEEAPLLIIYREKSTDTCRFLEGFVRVVHLLMAVTSTSTLINLAVSYRTFTHCTGIYALLLIVAVTDFGAFFIYHGYSKKIYYKYCFLRIFFLKEILLLILTIVVIVELNGCIDFYRYNQVNLWVVILVYIITQAVFVLVVLCSIVRSIYNSC